jgi:GxxExxY protein
VRFQEQVELPLRYRDEVLDCGYRLDFIVEDEVIVEIKSVERLDPVHKAQLISYLRLANKRVGLLINFNVEALRGGLQRVVNNFPLLGASAVNRG